MSENCRNGLTSAGSLCEINSIIPPWSTWTGLYIARIVNTIEAVGQFSQNPRLRRYMASVHQ